MRPSGGLIDCLVPITPRLAMGRGRVLRLPKNNSVLTLEIADLAYRFKNVQASSAYIIAVRCIIIAG